MCDIRFLKLLKDPSLVILLISLSLLFCQQVTVTASRMVVGIADGLPLSNVTIPHRTDRFLCVTALEDLAHQL